MEGLRQNGVEIIECNERAIGFGKFWRLYQKHKKIKNDYDFMIVGYPSQIALPLAKLISKKKVVMDALCSLYEGEIISRQSAGFWSPIRWKIWMIDFLAYFFADLILVETNAQIDFFAKHFFVGRGKCVRIFTGASDSVFFPDPSVPKRPDFTVVFRGQFLPEAGVQTILESAKILEPNGVHFIFAGKDFGPRKLSEKVTDLNLKNVFVISNFLQPYEIKDLMLSCHISLGQFANHERLQRTIPHKAFETLALGLPYITGRAKGVEELLTDGENCLMTNLGDPQDLADKILKLKNDPLLSKKIADNGLALYKEKLTPKILAGQILQSVNRSNP
jgi:glycosyltransferase involved in cell wall biosynthesis